MRFTLTGQQNLISTYFAQTPTNPFLFSLYFGTTFDPDSVTFENYAALGEVSRQAAALFITSQTDNNTTVLNTTNQYTATGSISFNGAALIKSGSTTPSLTVTVATATDVFTSVSAHGLAVGDTVTFKSTVTLPSPLVAGTKYYVITVPATTTFTISLTSGGTRVDVTDTGTGTHSVCFTKGVIVAATSFTQQDLTTNQVFQLTSTLTFNEP